VRLLRWLGTLVAVLVGRVLRRRSKAQGGSESEGERIVPAGSPERRAENWVLVFLAMAVQDPGIVPRMVAAMGFVSLVNMLYFLRSERSFDFLYGVLYAYFAFFALFWIFPYAILTVRARSWLTR